MLSTMTVLALLSFAAGVALVQTLAVLPVPAVCAALAAAVLVLACLSIRLRAARCGLSMVCIPVWVCAALAGFVWAALCAHDRLRDRLSPQWEGRDIVVIGTVADLPITSARGTRFLFAVERAVAQDGVKGRAGERPGEISGAIPRVPARLSLSWYAGRDAGSAAPAIAPGQRWQFTVRLTRPHGNANPIDTG